jgi:uncharacterized membrane protein YdbT with pleckstrin-like domain
MPTLPNPFRGISDGFLRWLDRIAEDGLVRMFWRWLTAMFGRRMVAKKLLSGEEVISQALHSWVAYVYPATHTHEKIPPAIVRSPVLVTLLGIPLLVLGLPRMPVDQAWAAIVIVLAVFAWAFYWALDVARDRFVITDSRVFRVWGVFSLHEAEMEIVRVLDITVEKPWYLRLVGSGHLILENAAQEQGLREIHLIPQASERAMAIHRRRRKMLGLLGDEDSATDAQDKPVPRSQHPRKPRPVTARWSR